jgi:hypothetical protein
MERSPRGKSQRTIVENEGYVGLYLQYEGEKEEARATYSIKIINQNDRTKDDVFSEDVPDKFRLGRAWGVPRFIACRDLEDPVRGFILNDTLMIEATVRVIVSMDHMHRVGDEMIPGGRMIKEFGDKREKISTFASPSPFKKSRKDMSYLFYDTTFADCELLCKRDKTVRGHTNILAMKSPVLKVMLNVDASAKQIEFRDIEPEIVSLFVFYCYYSELPVEALKPEFSKTVGDGLEPADVLADLLILAHRLGVQDLVKFCVIIIGESLTDEKVIKFLLLGHKFHLDGLKFMCIRYITHSPQRINALLHTEDCARLAAGSDGSLILDIFKEVFRGPSPAKVTEKTGQVAQTTG